MRLKCDGRLGVAGGKVAIRPRAVRARVSFHFRKQCWRRLWRGPRTRRLEEAGLTEGSSGMGQVQGCLRGGKTLGNKGTWVLPAVERLASLSLSRYLKPYKSKSRKKQA